MDHSPIRVPESPETLGLPFQSFRPHQREAVDGALNSPAPVIFLEGPTGTGKSLVGATLIEAAYRYRNWRSVLATKYIQLQDQYCRDFGATAPNGLLRRIVGQKNYVCPDYEDASECGQSGISCRKRAEAAERDLCDYAKARREAAAWKAAVVNFDYLAAAWPTSFLPTSVLNNRQLLVVDEGHVFDDSLRSAASVSISGWIRWAARETLGYPLAADASIGDIYLWADSIQGDHRVRRVFTILNDNPPPSDDWIKANRTTIALGRLAERVDEIISSDQEIIVTSPFAKDGPILIEPVFAAKPFRELMRGFKKIVIMSATLPGPDISAKLLNLKEGEYEVIRIPPSFPTELNPFYYVPRVKVKKGMPDHDLDTLVECFDQTLDAFPDERGIIHMHAYWLQKEYLARSRYKPWNEWNLDGPEEESRLVFAQPGKLEEAIHEMQSLPNGVLVSPAATTGVDLPNDGVRFQIIGKLPYPDLGSQVVRRRMEVIPASYPQAAASTVEQAHGRGARNKEDWSKTFIFDTNWGTWYPRHRHLFSPGFRAMVVQE